MLCRRFPTFALVLVLTLIMLAVGFSKVQASTNATPTPHPTLGPSAEAHAQPASPPPITVTCAFAIVHPLARNHAGGAIVGQGGGRVNSRGAGAAAVRLSPPRDLCIALRLIYMNL